MNADLHHLTRYHRFGDPCAFHALVQAHGGMVFAVARRLTQDAALAEEVAQDTFLALAKSGHTIRESVAAWLHSIARRKAINALLGEIRRKRHEQAAGEALNEKDAGSWHEVEPFVDDALEELPERLRSLVIEHYLEQRTQQEIAKRHGLSQSTVSRQIETGLQLLRDGLRGRGVICGLGFAALLVTHTAQAAPAALTVAMGKLAITGIGSTGTLSTTIIMTTTKTTLIVATSAVLLLLPVIYFSSQRETAPPSTAIDIASQPQSKKAKAAPLQQLPALPAAGGTASLETRLSEAEAGRAKAEAELAALRESLAPMQGRVIVNLGKVEDIGKRTGAILPALAEMQTLLERDPATLSADEKRRLLDLQRQHAEVLGMLPEIAGFQDRPEEYGNFFRNMIQQSAS
ncbi:MAG: hypothetical protein B7Z55_13010, partial [Planctomycetales bacterium 12-60-4]